MTEKKQPQGIILVDTTGGNSMVIINTKLGYTGYTVGKYKTLRPGHRDYIGAFELRYAGRGAAN